MRRCVAEKIVFCRPKGFFTQSVRKNCLGKAFAQFVYSSDRRATFRQASCLVSPTECFAKYACKMLVRHVNAGVFIMNLRKILKKVSVRGSYKAFLRSSRFDRLSSVFRMNLHKMLAKNSRWRDSRGIYREVLALIACAKHFPEVSCKMFAIFIARLCRHSCKKRRQMLFGNARIKHLRTEPIQIFPQPVSCRVSAARASVRARID